MSEDELRFGEAIRESLAAHPDWLKTVLHAVVSGIGGALAEANDRTASADLAMRAALLLAGPDRVTSGTKEVFETALLKFLEATKGDSSIERATRERLRAKMEGRR